ncbi:uncharacterized protein LOC126773499 [Nymphalis io]|uniref:uncharacterized protein LOC126773497 n=1 Tax=Inachis io TaxID=171585 RepID=UPI002169BB40|nr:uncharacterized protein LOC126773497 [Nymphalis io]XP_050350406.1 uncharacterized protein LOC126773499 [Nymphalis io]
MKDDIETDKSANQMRSDFERLCLERAKAILGISRGALRGVLLTANKDINIRWKEYYEQLMNEEFSSQKIPHMPPVEGLIKSILEEEIPADLLKKLKESATPWLTKLFNAIIKDAKIPESWLYVWAGGITWLAKVRNEYVSGSFKVTSIVEKLKECRPQWYGYFLRRDDDDPIKKALNIPDRPRGRGRPPVI